MDPAQSPKPLDNQPEDVTSPAPPAPINDVSKPLNISPETTNQPSAPAVPASEETPQPPAAPSSATWGTSDKPQAIETPLVNEAVVGMSGAPTTPTVQIGGSKKKVVLGGAIAAVLLVVLGGGFVFGFYLPNTPANIYKTSLERTSTAYDKATELVQAQTAKKYKSAKLAGDMKFTTTGVSGEGSITGASDSDNLTAEVKVNVAGEKATVDLRALKKTGNDNADVYLRVSGVKSYLDSIGAGEYSNLDGQWIVADHTLLDSYAAQLSQGDKPTVTVPTGKQVQDALAKLGEVNNKYLFTTDTQTAVLKRQKDLGTSTKDGRKVYGYEVGYDKTNMQDYLKAMGKALNSSSLNTWAMAASGQSISESVQLDMLSRQVAKAPANYTFTMYVDAKTKLIQTLHFKDTKSSDYFEIAQNYVGGTSYPFSFKLVSNSDKQNSGTFTLKTSFDTDKSVAVLVVDIDAKTDGEPMTLKGSMMITPSNDAVTVTEPTGAKPVLEVLQSLYGGFSGDSTSSSSSLYDDANSGDAASLLFQ